MSILEEVSPDVWEKINEYLYADELYDVKINKDNFVLIRCKEYDVPRSIIDIKNSNIYINLTDVDLKDGWFIIYANKKGTSQFFYNGKNHIYSKFKYSQLIKYNLSENATKELKEYFIKKIPDCKICKKKLECVIDDKGFSICNSKFVSYKTCFHLPIVGFAHDACLEGCTQCYKCSRELCDECQNLCQICNKISCDECRCRKSCELCKSPVCKNSQQLHVEERMESSRYSFIPKHKKEVYFCTNCYSNCLRCDAKFTHENLSNNYNILFCKNCQLHCDICKEVIDDWNFKKCDDCNTLHCQKCSSNITNYSFPECSKPNYKINTMICKDCDQWNYRVCSLCYKLKHKKDVSECPDCSSPNVCRDCFFVCQCYKCNYNVCKKCVVPTIIYTRKLHVDKKEIS